MERYLVIKDVFIDTKCIASFLKIIKENNVIIEFRYFGGEKVSVEFSKSEKFYISRILKKVVDIMNKRK